MGTAPSLAWSSVVPKANNNNLDYYSRYCKWRPHYCSLLDLIAIICPTYIPWMAQGSWMACYGLRALHFGSRPK